MKIFFATCSEKPNGTADDNVLREQLRQLGIEVEHKVWSDPTVEWKQASCVLIRSTWDYHRKLNEFLHWAKKIDGITHLQNPLQLIEWNASKRYLLELADKNIPITPSAFANTEDLALDLVEPILQKHQEVVLKPAISASGELTFRVKDPSQAKDAANNILARGEVLIQPYLSSIASSGEVSLIFFSQAGKPQFSHAVHKLPRSGDFRVQFDFGGSVESLTPSPELIDLGYRTLQALPSTPLYARIDIVDWTTEPKISEVELIEPELFFRFSSTSASMLASSFEIAEKKSIPQRSPNYYRFLSGNRGIYEAVDVDCPRTDSRRNDKPDGSWLPKVGTKFAGAISFWTEAGLKRYLESGLQDWHRRVVNEPLAVLIADKISEVLYADDLQIICDPKSVADARLFSWEEFAKLRAGDQIIDKVVTYITRVKNGKKELLVFDHDKDFSEAGAQVPAGTVDFGESLENALMREVLEEAGIQNLKIVRKIDEYIFYRVPHLQFNRRHVFEVHAAEPLPDSWTQTVTGEGQDTSLNFHYYWIAVELAAQILTGGLGDSLRKLRVT